MWYIVTMRYLHGKCQSNGVESGGDQEDNTWVDVDCAGVDWPQDSCTHQLATLDTSNHASRQSTWKRTWSWWRHQMEIYSALLALCHRWTPRTKPVTQSFDVFFHLRLNKRLSKQSWGWWFETPSHSLLRHSNVSGQVHWLCSLWLINDYRKITNIRPTKSQHLNDFRLALQLSLPIPLNPGAKSRMKM